MISAISQNYRATASSSSSGTTAATGTSDVTENMFLQLLVTQIKNQDPLSPADGTQFLTQLAQFQQLEQSMNMGTDLSAIRSDLDTLVQTAATTGTTTGTTSTTNGQEPPIFTSFSTALSALDAMSPAIDVVGNNLAKLNTP